MKRCASTLSASDVLGVDLEHAVLKTRLLTAVVLAPLVVAAIYWAPMWLYGLVFIGVTAAGAWEWGALVGLDSLAQRVGHLALFLLLAAVIYLEPGLRVPLMAVAASFWLLALVRVLQFTGNETLAGVNWLDALLGLIVVGGAFAALMTLRSQPQGAHWVMLALLLVWLADIGAYFAGRRFGRRKLLPTVSPGKSWEGVIGGMVVTLAVVLGALALWGQPLLPWLVAVPLLVLVSVLGDLFESTLKRRAGVKDSGTLLPGHGGMLDRIDAQLSVLPLFALLLVWLA
ncbi:MAG: phosphatidate cytidylyltransferase [Pseudomonadales bacterium]